MDFYKRLWMRMSGNSQRKSHYLWTGSSLCGFPKRCQTGRIRVKKELAGEVPAYKVVNSKGILSGAASFDYPDLQRLLLEEEGVEVSMDNQVDLKTIWMEKHTGRGGSLCRRVLQTENLKFIFQRRDPQGNFCSLTRYAGKGKAVFASVKAFQAQVSI